MHCITQLDCCIIKPEHCIGALQNGCSALPNSIVALQIFDQIWVGLLIGQIGNTALFAIKGFGIGVPLSIPAIVLTIFFRFWVASNFARPMQTLSFHAAADLDRADQVRIPSAEAVQLSSIVALQRTAPRGAAIGGMKSETLDNSWVQSWEHC
jgi:hypothetical protein